MASLYIWTEQQQAEPTILHIRGGKTSSARAAMSRFGFTGAEIRRVIDDLDCGREVRVGTFTLAVR